jgi:hypothetical protein
MESEHDQRSRSNEARHDLNSFGSFQSAGMSSAVAKDALTPRADEVFGIKRAVGTVPHLLATNLFVPATPGLI